MTVGKGSSPWFMGSKETVVAPLDEGVNAFFTLSMNDPFLRRAQKGGTQLDPNRGNNTWVINNFFVNKVKNLKLIVFLGPALTSRFHLLICI